MSLTETKREIYEYLYRVGTAELDQLVEAVDNDANSVYGAAKHLKWDGYLGADTGNNEWWVEVQVPGLCPECGDETQYGDGILEVCDCGWSETWECPNCGSEEPHHAIEFEDVEVDVTCESVYFTFTDDSGDPGMAFDHEQFEQVIDLFESR